MYVFLTHLNNFERLCTYKKYQEDMKPIPDMSTKSLNNVHNELQKM